MLLPRHPDVLRRRHRRSADHRSPGPEPPHGAAPPARVRRRCGGTVREPVRQGQPDDRPPRPGRHRRPARPRSRPDPRRRFEFVGVESTIVDLTVDPPQVLRAGAIDADDLRRLLGAEIAAASGPSRASGMLASHYAPECIGDAVDDPGAALCVPPNVSVRPVNGSACSTGPTTSSSRRSSSTRIYVRPTRAASTGSSSCCRPPRGSGTRSATAAQGRG